MNKIDNRFLFLLVSCFFVSFSLAKNAVNLDSLTKSEKYFIKEIDLNGDKLLDKVVSSKKYQGDALYFFVNTGTSYRLALKTTNFSEDGGNIIGEIQAETQNKEVISISTYFPDGGQFTTKYFIARIAKDWVLTRTLYETVNWQKDSSKKYACDIKQDIKLSSFSDGTAWEKLKPIPEEKDRDKLCRVLNL